MRLLYFGDMHERLSTPENRMDDYRSTMNAKRAEILSLGREHKVSAFLQPGDFFDSPNPSNDFVSEIMGMWTGRDQHDVYDIVTRLAAGTIDTEEALASLKSYIPIIGVVGNHELFGNNIKTLPKTAIGMVNRMGLMRFATKENPYFFYTEDGAKVAVTGTHYHLDIDTPAFLSDYIVEEKLGDFHIHIVHGFLSDKSLGNMFRHTIIDQIRHTKADLTITGHDHIGFPLTEVDGKYFVNPGAIPRTKSDIKEISRKPKVLLIDITKTEGMKLHEIYLKSAQDGEVVLNRRKIVERKKREERIAEFKKSVKDASIAKSTDIIEIMRQIAITKQISAEIRDDVVDRVSEKKQEMACLLDGVLKEAYVEKMIIENFQSHAYTELEFSRGLNIFVGESRQGKTAVLRAFQWVYTNKPTGNRVIKIGADCAKVTLFLSNGFVVTRIMESKRGGKNGYEITDPTTGEVAYHNTKILPEVQKILGYSPFVIDNDLQFNLNFMKQGSGWFLIGDEYSAPTKAKIIGGIYGTQYADAVARDLDAEDKRINEKLRDHQRETERLDAKIAEYGYLDDLETKIQAVEKMLGEVKELEAKKQKILSLLEKRKNIEAGIAENDKVISSVGNVEDMKRMLENLRIQLFRRTQLESVVRRRNDLITKLDALYMAERRLARHHEVRALWQEVEKLKKQKEDILKVLSVREEIVSVIAKEKAVIDKMKDLNKAAQLFGELKLLRNEREVWLEKLEKAKSLDAKNQKTIVAMNNLKMALGRTESLPEWIKVYDEVKRLFERKSKLQATMNQRQRITTQLTSEENTIQNQKIEIERLVEIYKGMLLEAGTCPVCYGTIDHITVKRIVDQHIA